jgi:hypothetical protein
MARLDIDINQLAVDRMLRGRNGPVSNDLQKRARRVARRSRQLAPGTMKRKITTSIDTGHVRVNLDHPAALFVLKGTRRHDIRKGKVWRGRKVLRFQMGGRTVFARWVKHPGNKPNNFLARALRETR